MNLKIFCIGPKSYLWYSFVIWYLSKWKYIKGVIAVEIWRRMVMFLFSTYNYGKIRTKFEILNTPSCWAHPSGPRSVNNWSGFVLLLISVICSKTTCDANQLKNFVTNQVTARVVEQFCGNGELYTLFAEKVCTMLLQRNSNFSLIVFFNYGKCFKLWLGKYVPQEICWRNF